MGDVKVVRDGKEITLENVQFFTYYADEDAEKENKPTVAFDFAVEPIEKNVGTVLGETFTQTCSMAKTVWTSLVWLVQGQIYIQRYVRSCWYCYSCHSGCINGTSNRLRRCSQ